MDKRAQPKSIGLIWLVAMAALVVALIVGVILYLNMSAPTHESAEKRASVLARTCLSTQLEDYNGSYRQNSNA